MTGRQRNEQGQFVSSAAVEVRKESQVPEIQKLIHTGQVTFILVFADWCGHCKDYKETWKKFEQLPGRQANIASVHYDMQEHIPEIAEAKIQGYPSVVKVFPNGRMEEYDTPGSPELTNAVPTMREEAVMKQELMTPTPNSRQPGPQAGVTTTEGLEKKEEIVQGQSVQGQSVQGQSVQGQSGGMRHLMRSFSSALGGLGPELRRMFGGRTYRAPKRSNRRGRTRRHRRS